MENSEYYTDMFDCNGIWLEPRLQEYIKKKSYYKKNNIIPGVSAEQEYNITKEDIKRMKALMNGEKDVYNYKKKDKFIACEDDERDNKNFSGFENDAEEMHRNDPRFKRYLNKVKNDKEMMKQRYSYSDFQDNNNFNPILDESYETNETRENLFISNKDERLRNKYNDMNRELRENKNNTSGNTFPGGSDQFDNYGVFEVVKDDEPEFHASYNRLEPKITKDYSMKNRYQYSNPFQSQSRRTYNSAPPTVQNNVRIYPMKNNVPMKEPTMHDPRVGAVIGELETYATKINNTYHSMNDMDNEHKMVIPNARNNGKKAINTASYRSMPYLGKGDGVRDISIETELTQGIECRTRRYSDNKEENQMYLEQNSGLPARGAKSYGYRNPVEHYFQYVSDDLQDPSHVVMDRGYASRLDNHAVARPHKVSNNKRDIY